MVSSERLEDYGFESFNSKDVQREPQPFLSIYKNGVTGALNKAAIDMLGDPEAIELLYSSRRNSIGLRPVDPTEPQAVYIRNRSRESRRGSYEVALQAFSKHHGIDVSVPRRYPLRKVEGVLVAALSEGQETGPAAKRRGGQR